MSKLLAPALACTLAVLGWSAAAVANPADHPTDHPAPKQDDHHEGSEHKDADHKFDHPETGDQHGKQEQHKGH